MFEEFAPKNFCACWPACSNLAEEYRVGGFNISPFMNDYCNHPCTDERHDLPPFHKKSVV